jgi:hypothetical protein
MGAGTGARHDGPMLDTFALRLRAWWQRDELDEQLEHGAQPPIGANTPLAHRAAQLRRRSTRNAMAAALENAVREAHKAWSVSARLPLARAEVRACAVDLVALALRLRADEPIDLRGAAMVARLVLNGTSPLYGDGRIPLRLVARSARLALDPPALTPLDLSDVI